MHPRVQITLCFHPSNRYVMKVTKKEIVERVKTCMEELTPQWEGTSEQTEGVSIERYIDAVINEQLRLLLLTAPVNLLTPTELKDNITPQRREDGSGRIELPDNCLRPVLLQMQDWQRPVTEFINSSHPLYGLQFNVHTRGGTAKPVAAWLIDDNGKQAIDYYSLPTAKKEHRVTTLLSILSPTPDATEYTLHPLLADTLAYRCASCIYDIMGNHAMAEVMTARCHI